MNVPDRHIQTLIDALTRSRVSFALYRLPWTDECCFILQTSGEVERLDDIRSLNGRSGFVIAPFCLSERHPLVVIRPEVTALGWGEIGNALDTLLYSHSEQSEEPKAGVSQSVTTSDRNAYNEAFARFITPLQEKRFQKLVLSRAATQTLGEGFSPLLAFVRACNSYPRMMISLCHTPATGTWLGSTPEILLSGHDKEWNTVALAGTMPIENEVIPQEWSEKNREEQAYVADYIRRILGKFAHKPTEKGPYTARAGQLVHLKTDFHFQLKSAKKLGDLLQALHPTPAVCGLPKEEAFRFITENEGYDRSYYSGFIGWLDPTGNTDLYVNLRCMQLTDQEATLYAGGGILALSDVEAEWEETREKMKTMTEIMNDHS